MSENVRENKMGTMPIPKLLFTMSLPLILSMLVQALYNIVDSVFVAQINENALTAASLAFPDSEPDDFRCFRYGSWCKCTFVQ